MPIYEYKCEKCGTIFSELRKISERSEPISCPECKGDAHVILSPFAHVSSSTDSSCPSSCDARFT
ncbi:MAG: zinc ribbon domain-containing protein [Candidatus Latescibacteria bacterium]|nr:zinc ribbon domain-containing protein [Candidatus Latescibacterota bacterium]NIM64478.1 zinc ribbon domain-containing protein [Candidatus Latescibacterota bacterium]NIO00631.1 zinc ribbon domain-containing protein [Candidatus Latescibacterota bacterium]NIO27033.1 zinc ribbon domain-containing protein [Candidatus Latescibacterota bacterium]NIO54558.1 zinc ribbon domain-containing protein [Candidatus Latescibacterota bacterium]